MNEKISRSIPIDLKWCEHIHNWGNAFYFIDCYNPFSVDGEYQKWVICPICRAERPKDNHD